MHDCCMDQVARTHPGLFSDHVGGEVRVISVYGFNPALHHRFETGEDPKSQLPPARGEVVVYQFLENFCAGYEGISGYLRLI